jgi:molecular chaperone GrpE
MAIVTQPEEKAGETGEESVAELRDLSTDSPHSEAEPTGAQSSQAGPAESEETEDGAGDRFERRWSKRSSGKTTAATIEEIQPGSADAQRQKARADELFERLQRSMADLSNYRKRVEAEREEMAKLAGMFLAAELLPVLDNFERALESIPRELEMFSWLQGIALIERHLRAILERQGVEPIEAVGAEFNPNLHEAIVEEESADAKPGTVLGELQRGYTMHGRVLRPTLAKVAKAASTGEESLDVTDSAPPSEDRADDSTGHYDPEKNASGSEGG